MNHEEVLRDVLQTTSATRKDVLGLWDAERPHFVALDALRLGGHHSFEDGRCVFCCRPEDYVPGSLQ